MNHISPDDEPSVVTLNFADDHPMAPKVRQLQKIRAGIEVLRASEREVSAAMLEWERDLTEEIVAEAWGRGFRLLGHGGGVVVA